MELCRLSFTLVHQHYFGLLFGFKIGLWEISKKERTGTPH